MKKKHLSINRVIFEIKSHVEQSILAPDCSDPENIDHIIHTDRFAFNLLSRNKIDLLNNEWLMCSAETIDHSWIIKRKDSDLHEQEFI